MISKEVEKIHKEKHIFTIILFYFFMCDDSSFINTTQKNFKTFQKMFQFPGWIRKNFIPGSFSWRVLAETWDASCFRKGLLEKQQSIPNTCDILPLKKIFFQNLTDAVFKNLVKNYVTSPTKLPPPPPTIKPLHQNKIFSPQQRLFWSGGACLVVTVCNAISSFNKFWNKKVLLKWT